MTKTLEVNCGTGDDAYTVVLTGAHANIFELVKHAPAVKDEEGNDKKGEDLVAAIMETVPYGVSSIKRFNKNELLNNGSGGEPAHQEFDRGKRIIVKYAQNGQLNDGPNNEPACQEFYDDGGPKHVMRYTNGLLNDGLNGEPARDVRTVFSYAGFDHKVRSTEHFKNGLLNDGLHGKPARRLATLGLLMSTTVVEHYKENMPSNGANNEPGVQKFSCGTLVSAWRIKDNGEKKALGSFARRKAQKQFGLSPE